MRLLIVPMWPWLSSNLICGAFMILLRHSCYRSHTIENTLKILLALPPQYAWRVDFNLQSCIAPDLQIQSTHNSVNDSCLMFAMLETTPNLLSNTILTWFTIQTPQTFGTQIHANLRNLQHHQVITGLIKEYSLFCRIGFGLTIL